MPPFIRPDNVQDRHDPAIEVPYGFKTYPALQKGKRLDEPIGACQQRCIVFHEMLEVCPGANMYLIITDQQGKKSGCLADKVLQTTQNEFFLIRGEAWRVHHVKSKAHSRAHLVNILSNLSRPWKPFEATVDLYLAPLLIARPTLTDLPLLFGPQAKKHLPGPPACLSSECYA